MELEPHELEYITADYDSDNYQLSTFHNKDAWYLHDKLYYTNKIIKQTHYHWSWFPKDTVYNTNITIFNNRDNLLARYTMWEIGRETREPEGKSNTYEAHLKSMRVSRGQPNIISFRFIPPIRIIDEKGNSQPVINSGEHIVCNDVLSDVWFDCKHIKYTTIYALILSTQKNLPLDVIRYISLFVPSKIIL
jgi:hypothetical protein